MSRLSHDRYLAVGAALAGLGGAGALAFYIYAREKSEPFWGWQSSLAVVVLAVGLAFLAFGFFVRDEASAPRQQQKAGHKSTNVQAGRDVSLNVKDE